MQKNKLLTAFLLISISCKFLTAQIGSDRNGMDGSLSYIDLICMNNQEIDESHLQHILNWDEIPTDLKGIKKIIEVHGNTWNIDSTIVSDTIMFKGEVQKVELYKDIQYISEFQEIGDSLIVTQYIKSQNDVIGFLKDVMEENSTQSIYVKGVLEEVIGNPNFKFNYYASGILKGIEINTKPYISSTISDDTIIYQTHNDFLLSNNIVSKIDDFPTVMIKLFKTNNDSCYCYQNYLNDKRLSSYPIINKQIIQCKDGKVISEKIWNRHDNYKTLLKDNIFHYENTKLLAKYSTLDNYNNIGDIRYIYNEQGYLIEQRDHAKGRKYIYDHNYNVIRIIDYWLYNNEISEISIREIEY